MGQVVESLTHSSRKASWKMCASQTFPACAEHRIHWKRSEWPRNRKRNHPLHQKMETRRVDGVKASLYNWTPRLYDGGLLGAELLLKLLQMLADGLGRRRAVRERALDRTQQLVSA